MGWLDQIPRAGKLYIGGLYGLKARESVETAGITHVISVMRWSIDEQLIKPYKHLQIEVDDDDDENLLEYFPTTNRFIQDALHAGGSVFVHCAMGKSRSATIVMAYLMYTNRTGPDQALIQLQESRPVCDPNDGFKKQLAIYCDMDMPETVEDQPIYQRWLYQRVLDLSRIAGTAPQAEQIRFEDEHAGSTSQAEFQMKCRKCRHTVANSQFLIEHNPKQLPTRKDSTPMPPSACAHYFLDPLSWMKTELEQGKIEGRLECPNAKCKNNIGKYAWQGMQCSCGDWVVPGISLAKGRIDEVKARAQGIKQPPALTRRIPSPGSGNL